MWAYNQEEQPPAPCLTVTLRHPEDLTRTINLQAKIDTGADISAIPINLIAQLGLPIMSKLVVEGYNGIPATVSTYSAHILIGAARFRLQEVIAISEPHALLGRDILNHFYVHLNGPELNFDLSLKPF